jgi:hypothetical protein
VLRPADEIDLETPISLPKPFEIIEPCNWISTDLSTVTFITRERISPRWTNVQLFEGESYDLFVVYHDRQSNLLFISASQKSTRIYEHIAKLLTGGLHSILPTNKINSVLATLNNLEFHNIGMRRRALHPNDESYRILAGSGTQNVVDPTDGEMYYRGHVACTGQDGGGGRVSIGYSSSSKVWGSQNLLVPQLVQWAGQLGHRIQHYENVKTGSGVDYLSVGEEITLLPDGIIATDWPPDVYRSRARRLLDTTTGETLPLLDFDLRVNRRVSQQGIVRLEIERDSTLIAFDYALSPLGPSFAPVTANCDQFCVQVGHEDMLLTEYFRENPPLLFLADFSCIDGIQIIREPANLDPFDRTLIEPINWKGHKVNIKREYHTGKGRRRGVSIHECLEKILPLETHEVVFYDHGPGEMADFLTFGRSADEVAIGLYHCKGSGGTKAGSRVGDVYEVSCQVVKSLIWLRSPAEIFDRAHQRKRDRGSRFIKGDIPLLKDIITASQGARVKYEMVLVQPGVSQKKMKENIARVLASANSYIIRHQCERLRVWGSD